MNHSSWTTVQLACSFVFADLARLRALAPPPGPGPFTLYRGVAGGRPHRRVRGLSWTDDPERAEWFARRYAQQLSNPGVYSTVVPSEKVLAFIDERKEREFVIFPPRRVTRPHDGKT